MTVWTGCAHGLDVHVDTPVRVLDRASPDGWSRCFGDGIGMAAHPRVRRDQVCDRDPAGTIGSQEWRASHRSARRSMPPRKISKIRPLRGLVFADRWMGFRMGSNVFRIDVEGACRRRGFDIDREYFRLRIEVWIAARFGTSVCDFRWMVCDSETSVMGVDCDSETVVLPGAARLGKRVPVDRPDARKDGRSVPVYR